MTNNLKNFFLSKTFNGKIYDNVWGGDFFNSKKLYTKNNDVDYNDTITYTVNEFDYRTSIETNDVFKDNLIACFGCSNTFGMAVEYEYTWPHLLNSEFGTDWSVKNYGVCGGSNDCISRLIYNYLQHNKPKIICCLFPDIFRMEFFDINSNIKNFRKTENESVLKTYSFLQHEFYMAYKKISTEDNGFYNFIKNFKFIESVCKIHNIKFYWSSWANTISNVDNSFIEKHLNIKNYIDLNIIKNNIDYGVDGIHSGPKTNKNIAECFYKKIIID